MAVAILIGLWIHDELSYNKEFQNYNSISRIMTKWELGKNVSSSQSMPLGTALRSSFKDDFKYVVLSTETEGHILAYGDKKLKQGGKFMQPEASEMLSLKMLKGSRAGLNDINSIMISESLSERLFGHTDPVNKLLTMDNKLPVKVTGVFQDFSQNTDFSDVSFLSPWDLYVSANDWVDKKRNDWGNTWVRIYTQLAPNADFAKVSAKIKDLKTPHVGQEEAAAKPVTFMHPMSKWHLYSSFGMGGIPVNSEKLQAIWFYATIGSFVLLLACINFMNLSTARSEKRAREVGIRKAIGSLRKQLVWQFFCESLLVALFSFLISIVLVWLCLPWFNGVADKTISILWADPVYWFTCIAFTVFTGLVAGSYPALYLSSFNAVKVLKGTFHAGRFAAIPRKVMVVVQFTVSISLIIGTIIVYRQIQFAKNRPVGYTREGLIAVPMTTAEFQGKYEVLRQELKNTGVVAEVAESAGSITGIDSGNSGFTWNGKDPSMKDQFATLSVTHDYGKTVGWKFMGGRDFSSKLTGDSLGFVINEAAAKYMGLEDPVGEPMTYGRYQGKNFKILGVVKDMVMTSPYDPASPTIFLLSPEDAPNWILIRVKADAAMAQALPKIEAVFKKLIPSVPFECKFVDTEYAAKFASEERIGKLAGFFAGLAIIISCLGLFGLASFVAEQRTKEIGVRKILGASVMNLWQMLSKDFLILVLISSLIAIPIAGYFMSGWLQDYQYRTELSWWIFGIAVIGSLLVTLLTVSYQAVKAALANPVKSLRAE